MLHVKYINLVMPTAHIVHWHSHSLLAQGHLGGSRWQPAQHLSCERSVWCHTSCMFVSHRFWSDSRAMRSPWRNWLDTASLTRKAGEANLARIYIQRMIHIPNLSTRCLALWSWCHRIRTVKWGYTSGFSVHCARKIVNHLPYQR